MVSRQHAVGFPFLHVPCVKWCMQLQMMLAVTRYDNATCRSHSWLPQQRECVICKHSAALLTTMQIGRQMNVQMDRTRCEIENNAFVYLDNKHGQTQTYVNVSGIHWGTKIVTQQ